MVADANAVEGTEENIGTTVINYNVTDAAIEKMRDTYKDLAISDKASYGKVVCAIREVRETRVGVDKMRKELKKNALAYGRRVDGEAKRITTALVAIEKPLKATKQAVDDIEQREKEELQRIEKERVTEILAKMEVVEQLGNMLANMTAEELTDRIKELANTPITEEVFEEYANTALIKKEQTLANLHDALVAKQEAAQAEEERAKQAAIEKEIADKTKAEDNAQRTESECVANISSSFTDFGDDLIGMSAESLIDRIAAVESMEVTELLFETIGDYPLSRCCHLFMRHGDGFKTDKVNTLAKLRTALTDRKQRDKDEEELKAGREKIAKSEADAKAEAAAKEKAEQEEREAKETAEAQAKVEASRPDREKLAMFASDYLQEAINNVPEIEDAHFYSILQSVITNLLKAIDWISQSTEITVLKR